MNKTDFNTLDPEQKRSYAAEQVAFWRAIQRDLDRIETALTDSEKTALKARVDAADVAAIDDKYVVEEVIEK